MASKDRKVEIFFLPAIMARGHMIPTIDTARLFASHGAKVTILTTTFNAQLFQKKIERDQSLGRDIHIHTFKLPTAEFGLPEGCENLLTMNSSDMTRKFFQAVLKLQGPIEQLLEERRPDCIVSDMFYHWTTDAAARLGIPRIMFQVTGLFASCCEESLRRYAPHEKVDSDTATFALPGLPHHIELTRNKIPHSFKTKTGWGQYLEIVLESEKKCFGVMANSFYDLEPDYAEYFKNEMGRRLWLTGPVYLFNKNDEEKAERGEKNSIDSGTVLKWLDTKESKSVLYVSFGSHVRMAPEQFLELALGLEASGHCFIWVARDMSEYEKEGGEGRGKMFPDGFEERVTKSGKGFIIKSWAPQLLILEHPAVGGFMTHCGWNSTVECLGAGLPMLTWPQGAEQFFLECFVNDVLKTGIRVGNQEWMFSDWDPKTTVTSEQVEKAVKQLFDGGDEVEEMRRRARELSEKAKKALEEGGSSHADVIGLINELKSRRSE